MKIINTIHEDYHMHSSNFSDGWNSVDEIVKYAGEFGLKKIVITDHSNAHRELYSQGSNTLRGTLHRWSNVINNVEVKFGVEADLLNAKGDICSKIQDKESDFMILSAHPGPYQGNKADITNAYINAMKRHADKINMVGHLAANYFADMLYVDKVIEKGNELGIPFEVNATNFVNKRTNLKVLDRVLTTANQIYLNSDAHTLKELKYNRREFSKYLIEKGYLSDKYLIGKLNNEPLSK